VELILLRRRHIVPRLVNFNGATPQGKNRAVNHEGHEGPVLRRHAEIAQHVERSGSEPWLQTELALRYSVHTLVRTFSSAKEMQ